jgi:hypothetical protein
MKLNANIGYVLTGASELWKKQPIEKPHTAVIGVYTFTDIPRENLVMLKRVFLSAQKIDAEKIKKLEIWYFHYYSSSAEITCITATRRRLCALCFYSRQYEIIQSADLKNQQIGCYTTS